MAVTRLDSTRTVTIGHTTHAPDLSRLAVGSFIVQSSAVMSDDDEDVAFDKESAQFQSKFGLPEDEILQESFMCALHHKGILHQGRLYVSQHYMAFYSNILVSSVRLVIRADRIEKVALAKVLIFPTAIRVTHDNGSESLFASFLSRTKCFKLIQQIARGEKIGRQRVKTSRELDKSEMAHDAQPTRSINISNGLRQSDKHQLLLAKARHEAAAAAAAANTSTPTRTTQQDTDDDDDDDDVDEKPTMSRLSSLLTSVHLTQAPPTKDNVISTPHGVIVTNSDARSMLPSGAKFKHARTGSLVGPGMDGPGVVMVAGTENAPDHSGTVRPRAASQANRSQVASPMIGPMKPVTVSTRVLDPLARASGGGEYDRTAGTYMHDGDRAAAVAGGARPPSATSSSRRTPPRTTPAQADEKNSPEKNENQKLTTQTKTAKEERSKSNLVALAMKPRKPRKERRKEETDDEEDDDD